MFMKDKWVQVMKSATAQWFSTLGPILVALLGFNVTGASEMSIEMIWWVAEVSNTSTSLGVLMLLIARVYKCYHSYW